MLVHECDQLGWWSYDGGSLHRQRGGWRISSSAGVLQRWIYCLRNLWTDLRYGLGADWQHVGACRSRDLIYLT